MTITPARDRNRADPARRQLSVLCWRGWCDHQFMLADIAATASMMTGQARRLPTHLRPRQCPTPGTCQCVHHDGGRP